MNIAIEHLNNKTDGWWDDIWTSLDPNDKFTLVYQTDFCGQNGPTSDQTVSLLKRPTGVLGVIGAVCADSTKIVQPIFRYTGKPILSWATGTADLNDKTLYPWFMRTVVSDNVFFRAIVDLAKFYGWQQIAIIQDDSDFGMTSSKLFRQYAGTQNITAGTNEIIPRSFTDQNLIIRVLQRIQDAHFNVVLLFVSVPDANKIGRAAVSVEMIGAPYVWLGTMAWTTSQMLSVGAISGAAVDQNVLTAYSGMFSVNWVPPRDTPIGQSYSSYILSSLSTLTDTSTPPGRSFAEVNSKSLTAGGLSTLENGLHAYDAVVVFAYAAARLRAAGADPMNGTALKREMYAGAFDGVSGRVMFDNTGERMVAIGLDVVNLNPAEYNATQKFTTIGRWDPTSGLALTRKPFWSGNATAAPNDGQCTYTCAHGTCDHDLLICRCYPGYIGDDCSLLQPLNVTSNLQQTYVIPCGEIFIYTFIPHGPNTVVSVDVTFPSTLSGIRTITAKLWDTRQSSVIMPMDTDNTTTKEVNDIAYTVETNATDVGAPYTLYIGTPSAKCDSAEFKLTITFSNQLIPTRPLEAVGWVLFGVAVLGLGLAGWFGYILHKHRKRKIFRKAGVDAVATIVIGTAIGFIGPGVAPWVPVRIGCVTYDWTYHFAFWLVYGSLLSKNIRIYAIFNNKGKELSFFVRDVNWKTCVIVVSVGAYMVAWTILNYTRATVFAVDGVYLFESCSSSTWSVLISAAEFVFLTGCAVLAWKTRKIPDDFNESRLIAIATYNAFVLKIFNLLLQSMSSAQQNVIIQLIGSNIEIFLSYLATVIIIFYPKLRSVYYEKHPQDHSSMSSSKTNKLDQKPSMREAGIRSASNILATGQLGGSKKDMTLDRVGTNSQTISHIGSSISLNGKTGAQPYATFNMNLNGNGLLGAANSGSKGTLAKGSRNSIGNVLEGIPEMQTPAVKATRFLDGDD